MKYNMTKNDFLPDVTSKPPKLNDGFLACLSIFIHQYYKTTRSLDIVKYQLADKIYKNLCSASYFRRHHHSNHIFWNVRTKYTLFVSLPFHYSLATFKLVTLFIIKLYAHNYIFRTILHLFASTLKEFSHCRLFLSIKFIRRKGKYETHVDQSQHISIYCQKC